MFVVHHECEVPVQFPLELRARLIPNAAAFLEASPHTRPTSRDRSLALRGNGARPGNAVCACSRFCAPAETDARTMTAELAHHIRLRHGAMLREGKYRQAKETSRFRQGVELVTQ